MKNRGFTLIECLVALFVLGLNMLMLTAILQQAPRINQQLVNRKEQEWQVFLIQLEHELRNCQFVAVDTYVLYLVSAENKPVTIDRINHIVRKRDNNGYHPLLTEVTEIRFQQVGQSIVFRVTFTDGEKKSGQWKINQI